jgi:hypothetical protein
MSEHGAGLPLDPDLLASVLVDDARAAALVPWSCPCEFGEQKRYRLEELVGVGGSSLVYRATDLWMSSDGFDATVAVKIRRGRAGDAAASGHDDWSDGGEALSARRITHPNVLSVIDRGVDSSGAAYLVAEYLPGGDLGDLPRPMPARRAASLMIKVARAVQAAHAAGVVHCDLKPSNILLTSEGEPKLADFNLARSALLASEQARGNAGFMAPEQFLGQENALSPPADIYALGGLLFFLLCDRLAAGATREDIAAHHRSGRSAGPPGAGGDLDRICLRSMAPRREDRYHSAGELADDLERWLEHRPITGAPTGAARKAWLWCRRGPVRALLIAVLVSVSVAGLGMWRSEAARARQRELVAQQEAARLAQEQIEELRARVQVQIRSLARAVASAASTDPVDGVLPAIVWLAWLMDAPVIGPEATMALGEERIAMLRGLLSELEARRREDLDTMLVRYALAYCLIEQGEPAAAAQGGELARQIRARWEGRLASHDAFWLHVKALERCAGALAAAEAGETREGLIAELEELEFALAARGEAEASRRLVLRTMAVLQKGR